MNSTTQQTDSPRDSPRPTVSFTVELAPELAAIRDEALAAMAADWQAGRHTPAETWLERFPQLALDEQAAVQIVYEEICLREERGERVTPSEVYERFPQWRRPLNLLIECHQLVHEETAPVRFPEQGESLGELQLVYKLGQGAAGRVFLATQPSLSDRPLAVKLTRRRGDEHLSLARLQHTHIAPLYHVQDFPERRLRAICMPYLGGTSWAALLDGLKERPPGQRAGRNIVDLLDAAERRSPIESNRSGPALHFLTRASYVQSVCWIGACLADALHYAHQCGLVHLDVKPSNVLITGEGQPMLLDFHLAREVVPAHSLALRQLGGTRNYMSPEQQAAAAALGEGRPNPEALDGRSDVYSLGVLLYESLGGRLPPKLEAESRRELSRANPAVGPGLADVVHKCLARRPADRYGDAGQLATDLRCTLADLPLEGVPNRSLRERWRKWRRRKPHALAVSAAVTLALLVAGASAIAFRGERLRVARSAVDLAGQSLLRSDYATAVEQLESAQTAIRWIPGQRELRGQLQTRLTSARQGRLAAAVHQLVEQLRFLDGDQRVPAARLTQLDAACAALWNARDRIAELGGLREGVPGSEELRADLTDLAISWAALRHDRHGAEGPRDALVLFDQAEALCGAGFALDVARREYASDASGKPVSLPQPQTGQDHYVLGRHWFRRHDFSQAMPHFEQAVERMPAAFWPYFYLALAAYRLEDYPRANAAANVCVALAPERAPCLYNRAMCRQALAEPRQALDDLDRALALDPSMTVAWLQRGALRAQRRDFDGALQDYAQALERGPDPADTHYQMALVEASRNNVDGALRHVDRALAHDRNHAPAAALAGRLRVAE